MIPLNPVPAPSKKVLYAFPGQSNNVAHGPLEDLPDFPLAYRVSIYGYNEQWRAGAEPMSDHTGITSGNMVFNDNENLASSGMAFANEMATEGLVGLIPCAKGGTSIAQWQKGGALYTAMTNRINAALQEPGTELGAIIWSHGEENTRTFQKYLEYKTGTIQVFTDMQNDFGKPIIFCQLGPNPNLPDREYWDEVKSDQASIFMDNVYMITTDDLSQLDDKVHHDTQSLVTIGVREALMMKSLII